MIERKRSSAMIIDYILDQIAYGSLRPGDHLPGERELAEELHVSRIPLREAICALRTLGILEARQGEGTFVNRYDPRILGRVIYTYTILENTSVDDLLEMRCFMEAEAARLASSRATAADLVELEKCLCESRLASEKGIIEEAYIEETFEKDTQFHRAICKAAGNNFLAQFSDAVREPTHRLFVGHTHDDAHREKALRSSIEIHQKIFDAIAARDSKKAYQYTADHITMQQQVYRDFD